MDEKKILEELEADIEVGTDMQKKLIVEFMRIAFQEVEARIDAIENHLGFFG